MFHDDGISTCISELWPRLKEDILQPCCLQKVRLRVWMGEFMPESVCLSLAIRRGISDLLVGEEEAKSCHEKHNTVLH
jgi:hypothetical protein